MANSKFEYVRQFEQPDNLLPNTWVVVRIDGRGFTKFTKRYGFKKPNDQLALELMNAAAKAVVAELQDIIMAYGTSDEYSFVFHKSSALFERRASKLISTVVSTFTAYYVHLWPVHMPAEPPLEPPLPSFDGRAVCYPSVQNLRDYMSWRQTDCHINNLFNTTFWALVEHDGMSGKEAEEKLKTTVAADKNEILFQRGINYNNEPEIFRKGSVVLRDYELVEPCTTNAAQEAEAQAGGAGQQPAAMSKTQAERDRRKRSKAPVVVEHLDIIRDDFWDRRPWLLSSRPGRARKEEGKPEDRQNEGVGGGEEGRRRREEGEAEEDR